MSDKGPDVGTALAGAAIVTMLMAAVVPLMLFIVVPISLMWIAYKVGLAFSNTDAARERKAKANAQHRYDEILRRRPDFPSPQEFAVGIFERLPSGLPTNLADEIALASARLYEAEGFSEPIAEPPPVCDCPAGWRYLDYLSEQGAKVCDRTAPDLLHKTLLTAWRAVALHTPEVDADDPTRLSTRLSDVMDCRPLIEGMILSFFKDEVISRNLLAGLREQIDQNVLEVSGVAKGGKLFGEPVLPTAYKGNNPIFAYLKDTPLLDILGARIPFSIPERVRFEHHHIVAGSGHGKTQTLQHFITMDLVKVAHGEASIVVIDSQGDLIRKISRLKLFARGQPLSDRLVVIDPTDIEFPITLGLFSVGKERLKTYAPIDRERLQNALVELLSFALGSLMSAEMTAKQGTLFSFLIRAMLIIPDATIHTFRELLEPNGEEKFREHLMGLSGSARLFFETEYSDAKQYGETRRQVLRRLWGLLENSAFERMMSSATSKFDLFTEMAAGKVILINADKSLLQQSGTEIFGRFFIAMIALAAQERDEYALPCFVYIDEFGDYAANADSFITNIFQQARKRRIGMIVAHQMLGDLSTKTADSIAANTSIKFVGGASHADAGRLAKEMRTGHDFVHAQRQGSFAAFVRNVTPTAVSLTVPFGFMEKLETMSQDEAREVRNRMRATYAQPLRLRDERSPAGPPSSDRLQETGDIRPKPKDLDEGDITPR
ncbi:type IV secretory system conjugative DNA transfer family protein [Mesorhizobium sp. B1-1-8]|uniref:type IV secretory system conjugative DNA transfer family protein n=1 Tax=Mesorhizobium sp. B1-1-8 TaxID=2589976 RepID=UPI00112BAFC9|nr:ATP-binding protein [Mesorhizobium sp. B1-1-8]UCI07373.1 type IV secretory system conjugative DNA transfer family protein [Mesorhizobium sp. B1-1-8]